MIFLHGLVGAWNGARLERGRKEIRERGTVRAWTGTGTEREQNSTKREVVEEVNEVDDETEANAETVNGEQGREGVTPSSDHDRHPHILASPRQLLGGATSPPTIHRPAPRH